MIDTPSVTRSSEQITAMVHITVPRKDIQKVMGPGIEEVKAGHCRAGRGADADPGSPII